MYNILKVIGLKIIISAGGTGGHIYPALAILKKFREKEKNLEVIYIGTHDRMEKDIVPKMGIKYVPIEKIYGILGNHDEYGLLESRNIRNIHSKVININGIKILGFEGSSRYKIGNIPMYLQEESIKILRECDIADILVSHDSPYQLYSKANDKAHCGMKGITKYLKKNKPIIV